MPSPLDELDVEWAVERALKDHARRAAGNGQSTGGDGAVYLTVGAVIIVAAIALFFVVSIAKFGLPSFGPQAPDPDNTASQRAVKITYAADEMRGIAIPIPRTWEKRETTDGTLEWVSRNEYNHDGFINPVGVIRTASSPSRGTLAETARKAIRAQAGGTSSQADYKETASGSVEVARRDSYFVTGELRDGTRTGLIGVLAFPATRGGVGILEINLSEDYGDTKSEFMDWILANTCDAATHCKWPPK
ncbi:hypothetical protein [Streptomyces sp. NBC_01022]|uniref:hypothetical protein n=1 Tax=Streptomyces sp. NBC_01022 TaxID=2903723 RepID=UPI002DD95746|nr:hypothetical protein [Streptomyces sp. NBC_01022]WRZ85157.1 hypothetical protein OG316_35280 [Streptomyces sp. NBC_01022]